MIYIYRALALLQALVGLAGLVGRAASHLLLRLSRHPRHHPAGRRLAPAVLRQQLHPGGVSRTGRLAGEPDVGGRLRRGKKGSFFVNTNFFETGRERQTTNFR